MSMDRVSKFNQWLNDEEEKRGWTDYRLSAEAQISSSVLSRARQGSLPKWDACQSIAKALGISPVIVFRKAGLLPPAIEEDEDLEIIMHNAAQMTEDEQEELLQYILMKRKLREERETRARTKKQKRV
ncbi:MAG: hypothetical protein HN975_01445 [Anaerolineae bacterium]|jgi:transcriptional regulator with XRE-family HTH domain|nr:hypothetical protein [Anaerolineae bacterium]